jgi:hypothetical protein
VVDLLSIPTGERDAPLNLIPQKQRKDPQDAIASGRGTDGSEPVLMVFEDVHWIDPTTRKRWTSSLIGLRRFGFWWWSHSSLSLHLRGLVARKLSC